MNRELTVQQLDPVGGRAAHQIAVGTSTAMVVYASVMTHVASRDIQSPIFAVLALSGVVALALALSYLASPSRAPVTKRTHALLIGAALVISVLEAASTWQANSFVRDDWAPVVLGLVVLALCPYRPPREIAVFGTFGALFIGLLVLVQAPWFSSGLPVAVYVIVAVSPALAMTYAGAAFTSVLVQMMLEWQQRATSAVRAIASQRSEGITRSVQQDRVTILNRDVVPFFADIIGRETVSEHDRTRAATIADSIRELMYNEVNRSWFDVLVQQLSAGGTGPVIVRDDKDDLVSEMSLEQRTAARAAMGAIAMHPALVPGTFTMEFSKRGTNIDVVGNAQFSRGVRSEVEPYLAVLRVVFSGFVFTYSQPTLTVRFSYEQR